MLSKIEIVEVPAKDTYFDRENNIMRPFIVLICIYIGLNNVYAQNVSDSVAQTERRDKTDGIPFMPETTYTPTFFDEDFGRLLTLPPVDLKKVIPQFEIQSDRISPQVGYELSLPGGLSEKELPQKLRFKGGLFERGDETVHYFILYTNRTGVLLMLESSESAETIKTSIASRVRFSIEVRESSEVQDQEDKQLTQPLLPGKWVFKASPDGDIRATEMPKIDSENDTDPQEKPIP